MASKVSTGGIPDDTDWKVDQDADTLSDHAEIVGDSARHKAAHARLQERQDKLASAQKVSKHHMKKNVKAGLAKAFPSSTPFQSAGKSGGTPFDAAGGKDED